MKRGRISSATDSNSKIARLKTHEYSGPSFSDLPRDILINILLRLPVKTILASKYVCKAWYELISDHEFAKLHSDQAESYLLIQRSEFGYWRMIHVMEPDKADFDLKLGMSCDHSSFRPGCVCNVDVKLDTKFQIREYCNRCSYSVIVNSCNGLLCLFNTYRNKDNLIIYNPITGEFINLQVPKLNPEWLRQNFGFGFGFSPPTNQYKMIRISKSRTGVGLMVDVHIIGTKTWKEIGCCIKSMPESFPIYLNGFLYWSSGGQQLSLISFNIESECFELVLGPTTDESYLRYSDRVGVLGGELCISAVLKSHVIHVWTMKDYGTEKTMWSKVFSFKLNSLQSRYCGSFQPINYLNNDGTLLMFYNVKDALIYKDPKTNRMRSFKVRGCGKDIYKVEVIAHIPSFVSLKHTFSGLNVKVLNLKSSRYAELKLQGMTKDIYLLEQEIRPDSY